MKSELSDQFLNNHAFINFAPNEEMSSDLQKKLKKINKLPDGLYETKFKIDRYKFDRALKNELAEVNSLQNLFDDIMTETNTTIGLRMTCKSNSKLRNPLVSVIGSLDGIELAKERILAIFENIKMRVVLKMDVSYKDHSHIIGRGGFSIQRVMDDSGSHIHFPDSNRISEVKKSNVVLVCGSPAGVEQARCKIRNLLPLVVHFKIPVDYLKPDFVRRGTSSKLVESYSKHLRPITQNYDVHISIRNSHDIDEGYAAIFDSSNTSEYIAVSVRGANNNLVKLKESLNQLINRLTDFSMNALDIDYVLTIEITEFYHQLVMGTNFFNIKKIMQQTRCVINFPEVEANQRPLDFDNLNEIPVNKSTVIIKGKSFDAAHTAWKELIGYLPLVLAFDVPHEPPLDAELITQLKKHYKVAIFLKHREKFNTVIIRGTEKNSRILFEVRKQLLKLDDAEIPICCDQHEAFLFGSKLLGHCVDENGNNLFTRNENTVNSVLNGLGGAFNNSTSSNSSNLNSNLNSMINGGTANILNTKMMHNIDSNNNVNDKANYLNQSNQLQIFDRMNPNKIDPIALQRLFAERILQLNNGNHRSGRQTVQQSFVNNHVFGANNHQSALFDDMNKQVYNMSKQQSLMDNSLRTHSVSDLASLQTSPQLFQSDSFHQSMKKEHLTSSCSSPSLHAIVHNNQSPLNPQHHNNPNNNFSMNTSNLNSTGNNMSSSATASTANNSFNSNSLTSSPPTNCNSSYGSLSQNQQSPMHHASLVAANKCLNWTDTLPQHQRQQLQYDECRLLALKKTYEKPDSNEVRIPSSVWSGLGFSKSMSHDTLRTNRSSEWNSLFNSPTALSGMNNSTVGGLGSDDVLKHSINKMNLASADPNDFVWPDMLNQTGNQTNKQRALIKQESEICSSSHPYSSSYVNSLMSSEARQTGFSTLNQANAQYLNNNNNGIDNQLLMNTSSGSDKDFIDVNKIDLTTVLSEYYLGKYVDVFKQYKIDFAQFLTLTEDDLCKMGIQYNGRRKVYTLIIELRKMFLSNYVVNNFTKNAEHNSKSRDDSNVTPRDQVKSLSNLIEQEPRDDHSLSPLKDYNGNQISAKKFSLFDDDASHCFQSAQKVMSASMNEICDVFSDSIKLTGVNHALKNEIAINSSTDVGSANNEKFNLNLNLNSDSLDYDKSPTNYSHNQDITKEADCALNSVTDAFSISEREDANSKDNKTDTNVDRLTTSGPDLIKRVGSSLQEIAQA